MLDLLALLRTAGVAHATLPARRLTNSTLHHQPQPPTPDFCSQSECACPWVDKIFTVPEAGGMGPFPDGTFLPYPVQYVAYRLGTPPVMDGRLDDPAWTEVGFTNDFVDISTPQPGRTPGSPESLPPLQTNAKMRWDDEFLYVGAFLDEPDVWANLTEQNSIIFYDPDFEVFVDPAGCNHQYKEFEMNAFNTVSAAHLLCYGASQAVNSV